MLYAEIRRDKVKHLQTILLIVKIDVGRVCLYDFKGVVKILQLYELNEMECYSKLTKWFFSCLNFNSANPADDCPHDIKYLEWRIL